MSEMPKDFYVDRKVWITGHRGMLGSAMVRHLKQSGAQLLLPIREQLDLTNQADVNAWVNSTRPDYIFHIGAKVGGIYANSTMPADFLRENLLMQTNVIHAAYQNNVKKLIFVASNCTYPKTATQPITEDALLTGELEEHIRSYAISKIAGIEMCAAYRRQFGCDYVSIIPPNLYGPGDNYHPKHSHVVAGILRRAHEAKISSASELVVWGDGSPRRELLHVDDLARAMDYLMHNKSLYGIHNIGCGQDTSIRELAELVSKVVGFAGRIVYDKTKPNGTMSKLLDSSRINKMGWKPEISLEVGLRGAYHDFLYNHLREA